MDHSHATRAFKAVWVSFDAVRAEKHVGLVHCVSIHGFLAWYGGTVLGEGGISGRLLFFSECYCNDAHTRTLAVGNDEILKAE